MCGRLGFSVMIILLCSGVSVGSNRADVNADGGVDAEDLSLLGNILAGNVDAMNYDMASVVVVAKQGGDFEDPADAADWVTSQSPASGNRFAILVMPGNYALDRAVDLPSYTVLAGVDRQTCVLSRSVDGMDNGVIVITDEVVVNVRNLTIFNSTATYDELSTTNGIFAQHCNVVLLQNAKIQVSANGGAARGVVFVWSDTIYNSVSVEDCVIDVTSNSSVNSRHAIGITNSGGQLSVRNSTIEADQKSISQFASCVYQSDQHPDTPAITKVYGCLMLPSSKTAGNAKYFNRSGIGGSFGFFHCVLDGDTLGGTGLIHAYCCDPDGNPVP